MRTGSRVTENGLREDTTKNSRGRENDSEGMGKKTSVSLCVSFSMLTSRYRCPDAGPEVLKSIDDLYNRGALC